jgi:hypothetical protein
VFIHFTFDVQVGKCRKLHLEVGLFGVVPHGGKESEPADAQAVVKLYAVSRRPVAVTDI